MHGPGAAQERGAAAADEKKISTLTREYPRGLAKARRSRKEARKTDLAAVEATHFDGNVRLCASKPTPTKQPWRKRTDAHIGAHSEQRASYDALVAAHVICEIVRTFDMNRVSLAAGCWRRRGCWKTHIAFTTADASTAAKRRYGTSAAQPWYAGTRFYVPVPSSFAQPYDAVVMDTASGRSTLGILEQSIVSPTRLQSGAS